jgi:DNA-binding transcriptional MerR regulator
MDVSEVGLTIGQAADLLDLPQSVLRYWESVIDCLSPAKSDGGGRRYATKDIELLKKLKKLLYEKGYTIKGANKLLNESLQEVSEDETSQHPPAGDAPKIEKMNANRSKENRKISQKAIIKEIKEILKMINS